MARKELEAMTAEVAPDPAPEPSPDPSPQDAPAKSALSADEVTVAVGVIVSAIGGVLCARLGGPPLTADEAGQLTAAGVVVANLYNWSGNPHVIAWGGLALVSYGVFGPRYAAMQARKAAARAEPSPGPAAVIADETGPVAPAAAPPKDYNPDGSA